MEIVSCYFPIEAWKPLAGGPIVFSEKKDCREIKIPCGQCIGCRYRRRDTWAIRCLLESKMHKENCFITLTYNDENLPLSRSLHYPDFQGFAQRLRDRLGPFRYFVCGEYGEKGLRPHWHALLFGLNFDDRYKSNSVYSSRDIFRSPTLEDLWPFGHSTIGNVELASARYCATYCVKKVTGARAESHYRWFDPATGECFDLRPEFARMSLKPGLGATWLKRYFKEVYVHNGIIVNGKKIRIPRYFDEVIKKNPDMDIEFDAVEFERYAAAMMHVEDQTRARLEVRNECAVARKKFYDGSQLGKDHAI